MKLSTQQSQHTQYIAISACTNNYCRCSVTYFYSCMIAETIYTELTYSYSIDVPKSTTYQHVCSTCDDVCIQLDLIPLILQIAQYSYKASASPSYSAFRNQSHCSQLQIHDCSFIAIHLKHYSESSPFMNRYYRLDSDHEGRTFSVPFQVQL